MTVFLIFWKKIYKSLSDQFSYLLFYLPASLVSIWDVHIIFDLVTNFISFLKQKR